MGEYDVQQVCLNGHQITASYLGYPEFRQAFCPDCGERTIHTCPECGSGIRGYYNSPGVLSLAPDVPSHCDSCGNSFPWTTKTKEIAKATQNPQVDSFILIEKICSRFHLIAKQLKSRHDDRDTLVIKDEYDAQDLLHAMLRIFFDDIREEEWSPSYAGSGSRIDFLLKNESIVIEAKKTRQSLKAKQLGEELIIDIAKYKAHPGCKKLFCFVYDPDSWIANPKGLEHDLNKDDADFSVKVIIVPKGH